jgi:predicted cupin superfamily sugar epimerase
LNKDAVKLIKRLRLKNHPEGGYFKQTYTADTIVNVVGYDKPRYISTAIYYMLVGDQFSALHRIKSDELWHHYTGGSLTLYAIHNGKLSKIKMGKSRGEAPQVAIKANTWFAASTIRNHTVCLAALYHLALIIVTGSLVKGMSLSRCILSTGRSLKDILPLFNSRKLNSDRVAYHHYYSSARSSVHCKRRA